MSFAKNDSHNVSKNSSKISNNSINSSELLRSINVDFNVFSIECDIQNIFYLTGAAKQPFKQLSAVEHPNLTADNSLLNASSNSNVKMDTSSSFLTKTKSDQHMTASSLIENKFLMTSTQTKSKARQKVITRKTSAPTPSTSATSVSATQHASSSSSLSQQAWHSNSKSTINTRRRTAMASSSSASSPPPQPPPAPNSASYLFSNNDDLYEV